MSSCAWKMLRARRERPRDRRTAEKCDELAPPHCPSQAGMSHRSGSNWEVGSGQVGARQCPLWVKTRHRRWQAECPAMPPKADIRPTFRNVRLWATSGH
jgi:hypothetical protein